MSTSVQKHLLETHLASGEHCVTCSKAHKAIAATHRGLQKAFGDGDDDEQAGRHGALADEHDKLAEAFASHASFHAKCAKSLGPDGDTTTHKAASGNSTDADEIARLVLEKLGGQLVPTGASVVIADNPAYTRQNVRPVVRPGQPDLERTQGLDPELQHFVKVED